MLYNLLKADIQHRIKIFGGNMIEKEETSKDLILEKAEQQAKELTLDFVLRNWEDYLKKYAGDLKYLAEN